jgi:N-acetyl-gamma-glutamyl-phosphate reductase
MIRTAILGASGFVGAELLRLMSAHPAFKPSALFGDSQAGHALDTVHPQLALAYPGMTVERFSPEALDGIDLVFAALPHGRSQRIAPQIIDRDIALVDLGADFRLGDAAEYQRWYGEPHAAPELLDRFVYGLPEYYRDEIAGSRTGGRPGLLSHVGDPGP